MQTLLRGPTTWKDVGRNALNDVAKWQTKQSSNLYKSSTPCLDDHQFKKQELETVGELPKVCSQIVLKWLSLARIGRPDILLSVNELAGAVTKSTRACDRRLALLISYIHNASDHKQYCHVNTAQHCRLDFSKTLILLGILKTHNRLRDVFYLFSGVERPFP